MTSYWCFLALTDGEKASPSGHAATVPRYSSTIVADLIVSGDSIADGAKEIKDGEGRGWNLNRESERSTRKKEKENGRKEGRTLCPVFHKK